MGVRDPVTGRFIKTEKTEPMRFNGVRGDLIVLFICLGVVLGSAWLLFFPH